MEIFVPLIIVFGVLQIILFFKIWGMTNDVRKLTEHFCSNVQQDSKKEVVVVSATDDVVEIMSCSNGKYRCYNPKTGIISWYNKEDLIKEE